MDDLCEYGIVAHFRDKTDAQKKSILDKYIKWAKNILPSFYQTLFLMLDTRLHEDT